MFIGQQPKHDRAGLGPRGRRGRVQCLDFDADGMGTGGYHDIVGNADIVESRVCGSLHGVMHGHWLCQRSRARNGEGTEEVFPRAAGKGVGGDAYRGNACGGDVVNLDQCDA